MEELGEFIEARYRDACQLQRTYHTRDDALMLLALGNNTATMAGVVKWMQAYNLFQGQTSAVRQHVAGLFLAFIQQPRPALLTTPAEAQAVFFNLHLTLAPNGDRKWLSAASKLLWCLYPEQSPMYDRFVSRSVTVLRHLAPSLAGFPALGEAPNPIKGEAGPDATARYAAYYGQFYEMVHALLADNAARLAQLRAQHNETYPYDVRILDKLLWMMGKG